MKGKVKDVHHMKYVNSCISEDVKLLWRFLRERRRFMQVVSPWCLTE